MSDPHSLSIEYCRVWNYLPRAAGLAEQIQKRFGITPGLIKSSGGVFEITLDGDLIFSKKKIGRFPEPGEIEAILATRLAS